MIRLKENISFAIICEVRTSLQMKILFITSVKTVLMVTRRKKRLIRINLESTFFWKPCIIWSSHVQN